ncbi:receptor-type tyrosine-protein phosphatase kappa-like [Mercenaria mercenaria]|uniref:receptor-type tyrosine-protein phosphatase kappa-like n=1 Tax=Mercenaria mercenaria TaxID=6596 RepID=UPI00234E4582|nr:receptor-type tyrosine-protein phosphatase kappa-like [Mercenaria mercenaria]
MIMSNDKVNNEAHPVNPGKVHVKEDYIYAQPDKSRMRKKQSKKEISKPQKMYDNIAIDLEENEATATVNENDVDKIQLEELEEGPTKFIETDVKPPSTDLYYNTSSLIRSRIQVSDILEYVKKKNDYEKEFEKLPKGLTRTCDVALKRNNCAKNRYNGIYAYDATRVVLQSKNYINANYIDGHKASPAYIASLGPTKSTMSDFQDFWEMIRQERTDKIVMLTNLEESKKMKCEQYWPEQGGAKKYGKYKVTSAAEKRFTEFTVREFTINAKSETRQVTQYHYTAWPDKSVPDGVATLLEFRDKVEQSQTTNVGPMVVHCSAGIGRTGTYIALDILIKEGKDDNYVDFFGCVMALRGQRAHMVQNLDQYIFLHPCVLYALTCYAEPLSLTSIPNIMTDEKILQQYQTFTDIQIPMDKDRRSVANSKSRKGIRSGADIPCDDHRVPLTLAGHDYINAVYVNGYEKSNKFILAQTPLPNTVEDFVFMLYQEKCPCIVCLDEENIKDKTVGYYLPHANKASKVGHFQVTCKTCNSTEDIVVRELTILRNGSQSSEELKIKHYQFRGWNNSESAPSRVELFLKMVKDVENERKAQKSEQPIVVHCLTGAERSGLFCVVSLLSEKLLFEKELSVLNTLCQVRTRRRSAFHDIEHYRFCYKCVKEMSEISDSSTYYNMNNM